jgi:WD40 repeat protein
MKQTLDESPEKGLAFQQVVFSADGGTIAATVDTAQEVVRPDGREILFRNAVKVWDAKTLALKRTLGGDSWLSGLALSPDGKLAAAGNSGDKTIKLWDIRTGKAERTLDLGGARPLVFAFSPDGKSFAIGCQKDGLAGEVQLWDTQTWKRKHAWEQDKPVITVAFSAEGTMLTRNNDDLVQLWDVRKGELVRSLKGVVRPFTRCVTLSPDGRTVAASWKGDEVRLWDAKTGERKTLGRHSGEIHSLAFSPDGRTLASTGQDETVRLWPLDKRAAGSR